jgi:VanZ family protein
MRDETWMKTRGTVGLLTSLPRCAFLACICLLVALSWTPGEEMVRTGLGGHVEHVTAYFLTAIVMGIAYREARWLPARFLLLVVLAAILEAGQSFVPGRSAAFPDFLASSTGVALGAFLSWSLRPLMPRYLDLVDGGRRSASDQEGTVLQPSLEGDLAHQHDDHERRDQGKGVAKNIRHGPS